MHDHLRPDAPEVTPIALPPRRPIYREQVAPFGPGFAIFGILLPLATLLFELNTRGCAEELFDPIPTWWHVLLVALVPVSNALIWFRLGSATWRPGRWLHVLAGCAIGVTLAYSVAFLPMMPFALIGVLFGIGFLPLSPIIALLTCLRAWRELARVTPRIPALPCVAAGLLALALPFGWARGTDLLIELAVGNESPEQLSAVKWLRRVGSEARLLERCYPRGGGRLGLSFAPRASAPQQIERIRALHYRVTGVPFNHLPRPVGATLPGSTRRLFNTDTDLGGQRVGGRVPGLTLESSELETLVNKSDLTAYSEWTFVFRNVAANASEARAQIELPPEGVVSRLTLWINGKPCEAAFAARSQVRAAYQEVAVVQQRDPVLVTTSGLDRVLMQCFPVPAGGGEMKVRVGITAPIEVLGPSRGRLAAPRIVESNFANADTLRPVNSLRHAPGEMAQPQPASIAALEDGITTLLDLPTLQPAWCEDPGDAQFAILQTPGVAAPTAPRALIYVIDGSANLRAHRADLLAAFGDPAARAKVVYFAGDVVERWDGNGKVRDWLDDRSFGGGSDNQSALRAAWIEAAQLEDSAVVWIHGPQPVALGELGAAWPAGPAARTRPPIYDCAVSGGANHLLAALTDLHWRRVPRAPSVRERLSQLWQEWTGARPVQQLERARIARASVPENTPAATRHIARLWANEEVERLRHQNGSADQAAKLAASMQLVTPVSGAVVLERQEQYERHGLKPVSEETVPAIPEPASITLLAASAALLALKRRRSKARH